MTNSSSWLGNWFKRLLGTEIQEEAMIPVRNFVFIWNVFENQLFGREAHEDDLFNEPPFSLADEETEELFRQIYDRYIDKDDKERFSEKFIGLFNEHGNRDHCETVKRIIVLGMKATVREKNLVCRMVLWRYRCNLFHGEKSAYYLLQDNSLFEPLNMYMIKMIDKSMK